MGKNSFIAIVALLIAVAGAIVAFAAYFKRRKCALCEDFDDELMDEDDLDYYATQVESDDDALEEQTPDAEAASSDDKASDADKKDPDEEE